MLFLFAMLCAGVKASESLVRESQEGNLVFYTGSVTLSGEFTRRTDRLTLELLGDKLCFSAVGVSAKLIPREDDSRAPWFCFSNGQEAMQMLQVPASKPPEGKCGYSGEATLTVTRYIADRNESCVSDMAQLIDVIASTMPQLIDCPDEEK
ncbi:MAG: hypothetical protein FWH15_10030 [Betaproteobacteria bacterium]|nr:hypothetical protein [Betaproteobacteria bacterium]